MKRSQVFALLAALSLALMLTLSGCKSSNQQTNNSPSSMPGVQSPAAGTQQSAAEGANSAQANPVENAPEVQPSESAEAQPGAGPATEPASAPASQPRPAMEIPAGTALRVRLNQDLGSKISVTGDSFSATLANDVVVDRITAIPRGARVRGTVIDAKPLGKFKGGARLAIRLEGVRTEWGSYPIATSTVERTLKGKGKRSAKFIAGGGGLGALIGGIAGGGKGAAIGAAAGAGAGTVGATATGNKQIVLPAGSLLTFRLQRPVRMNE